MFKRTDRPTAETPDRSTTYAIGRTTTYALNGPTACTIDSVRPGDVLLVRYFASTPRDVVDVYEQNAMDEEVFHVVNHIFGSGDGRITDLDVEKMDYRSSRRSSGPPSYQIYGDRVIKRDTTPVNGPTERRLRAFSSFVRGSRARFTASTINPSGPEIIEHCFDGECPVGCENGWLLRGERLLPLLEEGEVPSLESLGAFRPLCPVCFGKQATKRQIDLRRRLEGNTAPDWTLWKRHWMTFRRDIRNRSWRLGYEGCDCSLCLLPTSRGPAPLTHEEAVNLHYGLVEFDATTQIEARPAAESDLASFSRKSYAETLGQATKCPVCQDDFDNETQVMLLPCGHVICADECIEWLCHQNSCPLCRRAIDSDGEPDEFDEIQQCSLSMSAIKIL